MLEVISGEDTLGDVEEEPQGKPGVEHEYFVCCSGVIEVEHAQQLLENLRLEAQNLPLPERWSFRSPCSCR